MNAKKKNKKANKPPNSNPPQNVENVTKTEENIEKPMTCEVKEEKISKPEIISEVIEIPMSDITESDTPKKPKRNKGKKKNQDKDDEILESSQEKPQKSTIEPSVDIIVPAKLLVTKEGDEESKNMLDEASLVPSARKKKNKKKTQENKKEEAIIPDEVSIPAPKEQIIQPVEKVDTEIQELFSSQPETPKQDAKKKKNKKKNRTDSERSDKSEHAVSCTSAFQKLLVDEMAQSEQKTESLQEISFNPSLDKKGQKNVVETKPSEEMTAEKIEAQPIQELSQSENKSKKKNKKDKKQAQHEAVEETKPNVPAEVPVVLDDKVMEMVSTEEPKKDVKDCIETPLSSEKEKEPSPKPKAKIAKPVEKKRKEKLEIEDAQSSGNLSNIESTENVQVHKQYSYPPEVTDIKLEDIPTTEIVKTHVTDQVTTQDSAIPKQVENMHVPSDITMGKKRKKSPKPPKHREEHVKKDAEVLQQQQQSEIVLKVQELPQCTVFDLNQPEVNVITSEEKEISKTTPEEMFKLQEPPKIDIISETRLDDRPATPEVKKDDEGFETKTNKKKKKTPKVPQGNVAHEVKEEKEGIIPVSTNIEYNVDKSTKIVEDNIDFPKELPLLADIEVRSVKTDESEASSCDVMPDVFFIRSSSQQFLDDNNNTIIQELMHVDEVKLNDPLLVPLIDGSGETPIRTPELLSSGIRITEFEPNTLPEEKTDIKSKMMEVNQDMEELRLSIERSLAEFTALEKCEVTEKNYAFENKLKKEKSPLIEKENKTANVDETVITSKKIQDIPTMKDIKEPEKSSPITSEVFAPIETPPICPARKDNKGKSKSKKKGKQETIQPTTTASNESPTVQSKDDGKQEKQEKSEQKSEQKSESTQQKGKQQSATTLDDDNTDASKGIGNEIQLMSSVISNTADQNEFEPIEKFEDALTSSVDDVNKTFEMIAKEVDDDNVEFQKKLAANKPEINITEASEDTTKKIKRNEKINPVSQPKNLLGQTDIPVQSNRIDYKKEKNKAPNARQARVKIKDSMDVEKKQSKESQTEIKKASKYSDKSVKESFTKVKNDNEEYVYKYSFRKVFLQSACLVCNKDLNQIRVPCGYCNLVFYCGAKHKDDDWPQHQALCFAVSTLAHMKDQKHIYTDAQNATGQDYRLLRMQMIVSCEKVLKRRLVPWEQEAMLYPRICADVACREWRQGKLKDCDGCGQLSYCAAHPSHLPKSHARWCKSYSLYQKLVSYQQTKGRLEPKLPTKIISSEMPTKINEVLASLYEEKIDMNDIQYAALTQLATAPLTAVYCLQLCRKATGITNGVHKKQPFTIHVVGAELQFEADALNKWETFFLHLKPDVEELKVVLVSPMLNPGNLPLDLLGKIKLCDNCHQNKRRVVFKFEDNKNYHEYRTSDNFINPDIICAFNPSIQRSAIYNGKDPWPATINCILKLKEPFIITSYTLTELRKDVARIKQVADIDFKLILEPGYNSFASVRPDRNFISDDEMPLLFKNYCVSVLLGC